MSWSQFVTVLWLRWRLTRNQWSRQGTVAATISVIVSTLLAAIGAAGLVGGFLAGAFSRVGQTPQRMLVVWDALIGVFLLFWLIGVLSEIQRSEAIDIGKILHLPVSLTGIFLVNYVASHLTLSIIVFVPWMAGLAVGFVWSRGAAMLLLLPLAAGFLFSVTAWTYWLRGWLVALLVRNPRRYRAIVAGITITFMLLSQIPNLITNARFGHNRRSHERTGRVAAPIPAPTQDAPRAGMPSVVLLLHRTIPPLWVGGGAMSLAAGHPGPALLGTAGAFVLAGLGLGGAYRSTRRFYEGRGEVARSKRKRREAKAAVAVGTFLERRLPGIPEEAAVLALATFRSFSRATEVKMTLASMVPVILIYGGMMFFSAAPAPSSNTQLLYATGIALLPLLGLMQILNNQFGFDRSGFRTLVLSPAPRWQILLGKNLALLPLVLGFGLLCMVLAAVVRRTPPLVLLAALVQLLSAFLLLSLYGSFLSISAPMRVAAGALKPTKLSTARRLSLVLSILLFPVIASPLLLPAIGAVVFSTRGGPTAAPMMLLFSVAELAVLAALYPIGLRRLGRFLQCRERDILQAVTQEVE
jgi:ABC-2 type transport system permease protein